MNHAPRISLPYADISGAIALWAESATKVAVFEHHPDSEDPTIHCHVLVSNCTVDIEALKRRFHSVVETSLKSNKLWAWTHKRFPVIESLDTSGGQTYLTYMTKGELSAKYLKNITWLEVETAKARWVKTDSPQYEVSAESKSEFDIILKYLEQKHSGSVPHIDIIRSDICYHYLSRRKAVPRSGDLSRYAYSAYMIMNANKAKPETREAVLRNQISSYLISIDSGNIK